MSVSQTLFWFSPVGFVHHRMTCPQNFPINELSPLSVSLIRSYFFVPGLSCRRIERKGRQEIWSALLWTKRNSMSSKDVWMHLSLFVCLCGWELCIFKETIFTMTAPLNFRPREMLSFKNSARKSWCTVSSPLKNQQLVCQLVKLNLLMTELLQ